MAREHKATAWDIGNDLVACADYLGEKEVEAAKAGFEEHADLLRELRMKLARYFNKNHPNHGFGLGPNRKRQKP